MSTFWRAVSILELACQLKVIAAVLDGASPNRKFYRIHKFMESLVDNMKNVTYKTFLVLNVTFNVNCLYHSGSGRCTRYK